MEEKNLIKQDINFLDSPNWLVDEKSTVTEIVIKKENGEYKIKTTASRLPNRFDKVVYYYFLFELFKKGNDSSAEVKTTRYKIAKNVFSLKSKPGKNHYDRIWEALKKWHQLNIEFKGVFYEHGGYSERLFHLIDSVILTKQSKEIVVRFNTDYIKQLKESKFYKYIDFKEYKKLKRPISARLYEILSKTFKNRFEWHIDVLKLAEKITIVEKYPSHVVQKIIPALNEINEKTELKIKFDYNQSTGVCTFTKFDNAELISISKKQVLENETFAIPEKYLNLLPVKQRRKEIYKVLNAYILRGSEDDFLSSNITYTAQNSKTNFLKFLKLSLKNDYAKNEREEKARSLEVEKEIRMKAEEQERIEKEHERIEQERKKKESENIINLIKQLPEHHYKEIELQAEKWLKRFPAHSEWSKEKAENWHKNFMVTAYEDLKKIGKI